MAVAFRAEVPASGTGIDHPVGRSPVKRGLKFVGQRFCSLTLRCAYSSGSCEDAQTSRVYLCERGRFASICGFMINLGRFGIFTLGPALLAGFKLMGMYHVPPQHWRLLFWVLSGITVVAALAMAMTTKNSPQEACLPSVHPVLDALAIAQGEKLLTLRGVFLTIITTRSVWFVAAAYACTGAVRQGVDQWFPR